MGANSILYTRKVAPLLLTTLLLLFHPVPGETEQTKPIRLYGRGYSVQVGQPAGWILDTRSAPQLANFILHPVGTNWRQADTLIFVRFNPEEPDQSLEEFLTVDREKFLEECPFGDPPGEPKTRKEAPRFRFQRFRCPGVRDELVAAVRVPGMVITFALTTQKEKGIERSLPAFLEVLKYFEWQVAVGSRE